MKKKINHLLILALIVTISLFIIMNSNTNCNNTEFKITKEECLNETFELELSKVINGERTITVYDIGKTKLINLAVEINLGEQCFNESAKKCKGYYEVCEDVEYGNMILNNKYAELQKDCGTWKEIDGDLTLIYCLEMEIPYNIIEKQELSTEWLRANCEQPFEEIRKHKCGSYTVEVLN